jgi:hypothetical protein
MITKWLKNRVQRRLDQQQQRADAQLKLEQQLVELGPQLKDTLMKAGIFPFSRINRNLEGNYIEMYGTLNGRLVKGEMTAKGAFLIKYVEGFK